ncbi:hypothetical protein Anas_05316 [Armadillidium nasatum]|uniref:Uncharacterized protein n=1 Tax=Armadillidium nasatum TaxID=96803 RepID=A0A5N5SUG3_9CRUS|nr:hypothetical protein Anas_05316 [Armadillidium nasatum]
MFALSVDINYSLAFVNLSMILHGLPLQIPLHQIQFQRFQKKVAKAL